MKNGRYAWLYLLPAIVFLGAFMVYPLIDVLIYSFEEGYNSASQTFFGYGTYNFSYVLRDPYFLQALKNTFILVIVTVPLSTGIALLISVGLASIKPLRRLFSIIIIRIDNNGFAHFEENSFCFKVIFHILVIIKMLMCKVCEDCNIKLTTIKAMLVKSL